MGAPNSASSSATVIVKLAGKEVTSVLNTFTFALLTVPEVALFLITMSILSGATALAKYNDALNLPWKLAAVAILIVPVIPPASVFIETAGTSSMPILLGMAPSSLEHDAN